MVKEREVEVSEGVEGEVEGERVSEGATPVPAVPPSFLPSHFLTAPPTSRPNFYEASESDEECLPKEKRGTKRGRGGERERERERARVARSLGRLELVVAALEAAWRERARESGVTVDKAIGWKAVEEMDETVGERENESESASERERVREGEGETSERERERDRTDSLDRR
jgi:hypothetical protein